MKINEIYIRSFGKLKDYKLTLTDGLNVLFGENEAGKTTIFNFILAMLYGIANSRGKELSDNIRKRYLTWGEDKIGGTMTIEHGGVTYVIDRRFGKTKAGDHTEVTNLTLGEAVAIPGGKEIGEYLLDLDEKSFRGTCFIGQLAKADVCNNDNVRTKLSNLSNSGNTEYSFDEVFTRLKNASLTITRPSSTGKIHPLEVRRGELEARNSAIEGELGRIATIDAENAALEERLAALTSQLTKIDTDIITAVARKKADEYKKAVENNKHVEAMRAEYRKAADAITHKGFTADRAYVDTLGSLLKKRDDAMAKREAEERSLESEKKALEIILSAKPESKKTSALPFVLGAVASALVAAILYLVLKHAIVPIAVFGCMLVVIICAYFAVSIRDKSKSQAEAPEISAQRGRINVLTEQVERLKGECELCEQELISQYVLFFEQDEIDNAQNNIRLLSADIDKYIEAGIRYDAIKSSVIPQEELDAMRAAIGECDLSDDLAVVSPEELEKQKEDIVSELSKIEKTLLVNKERAKGKGKLQTELESNLAEIVDINEKIKSYEYAKQCVELAKQGLETAQSQMQKQFAPDVSRMVSDILSQITDGKYTQMTLNSDLQTMVIDGASGAAYEDGYMSAGTLDQIYLALRFAMISLIFNGRECPVICMDDALLNFDPSRMSKAAQYVMNTLSQSAQVLFFTCRETEKSCFSSANLINVQ